MTRPDGKDDMAKDGARTGWLRRAGIGETEEALVLAASAFSREAGFTRAMITLSQLMVTQMSVHIRSVDADDRAELNAAVTHAIGTFLETTRTGLETFQAMTFGVDGEDDDEDDGDEDGDEDEDGAEDGPAAGPGGTA